MDSNCNKQCDYVSFGRDNHKGNEILGTSKDVLGRRRKRRDTHLTRNEAVKLENRRPTDIHNRVTIMQNPMNSINHQKDLQGHRINTTDMEIDCSATSITSNCTHYYKCKEELSLHVNKSSTSLPKRTNFQFKHSSYIRHLSNSPQMLLLILFLMIHYVSSLQLQASVSQNGVQGTITFTQSLSEGGGKKAVQISANFSVTDPSYAGEYSWGIYNFPIDYSRGPDSCHSRNLGRKPTLNFDTLLAKLMIGMVPDEDKHASAFPTDSGETTPETEEVTERARMEWVVGG